MSISISRANLPGSGAPKITYNGATLWTKGDLMVPLKHSLQEQVSSMYGRVTKTRQGRKIELSIPVYGFWTNLSVLFPSYILGFTRGARIFGSSDTPMVILARNGDKITIVNAQITGLMNLKLAANQQIFSADLKVTGLIGNNLTPQTASAYYTLATAQAYAEGDFPQSNFKSLAWSGAWGSRTGFTNILTQDGWDINWEVKMTDDLVDGIGAVDMFVDQFWASASAIVVGPTLAQLETAADFQGTNAAVGADMAADSDDMVLTDGTSTLTLKKCGMVDTGLVFGPGKKRIGKTVWESTLSFSSGAPVTMAAVA